MIGRNYLIIFLFAKLNFSVCITVYGMLDTMLASRGHRNLLFHMRTCMLEPPDLEQFGDFTRGTAKKRLPKHVHRRDLEQQIQLMQNSFQMNGHQADLGLGKLH